MLGLATLVTLCATPLVFGDEEIGWFLLDERGEVLRHLTDFGGERAVELALSPDAKTFALVTGGGPTDRRLLRWRDGDPKPVELSKSVGHYASPAFSPNGEWLYFTHNGSGPPGSH